MTLFFYTIVKEKTYYRIIIFTINVTKNRTNNLALRKRYISYLLDITGLEENKIYFEPVSTATGTILENRISLYQKYAVTNSIILF